MSEIRKGFLLGIGLIIPLLAVQFITVKYSFLEVANDSEGSNASYESYNTSYIEQISLSPTIEKKQGVQLLISGQFTNNSEKSIGSLEIEAELFDAEGKFVYECSKSFYEPKKPGLTENYLIKCGCSKNGIPEYKTAKVRVVKASSY